MKTKVSEKFIIETKHRTQQYTTNNRHLGRCEFVTIRSLIILAICSAFLSNAKHQDTEELKENWINI